MSNRHHVRHLGCCYDYSKPCKNGNVHQQGTCCADDSQKGSGRHQDDHVGCCQTISRKVPKKTVTPSIPSLGCKKGKDHLSDSCCDGKVVHEHLPYHTSNFCCKIVDGVRACSFFPVPHPEMACCVPTVANNPTGARKQIDHLPGHKICCKAPKVVAPVPTKICKYTQSYHQEDMCCLMTINGQHRYRSITQHSQDHKTCCKGESVESVESEKRVTANPPGDNFFSCHFPGVVHSSDWCCSTKTRINRYHPVAKTVEHSNECCRVAPGGGIRLKIMATAVADLYPPQKEKLPPKIDLQYVLNWLLKNDSLSVKKELLGEEVKEQLVKLGFQLVDTFDGVYITIMPLSKWSPPNRDAVEELVPKLDLRDVLNMMHDHKGVLTVRKGSLMPGVYDLLVKSGFNLYLSKKLGDHEYVTIVAKDKDAPDLEALKMRIREFEKGKIEVERVEKPEKEDQKEEFLPSFSSLCSLPKGITSVASFVNGLFSDAPTGNPVVPPEDKKVETPAPEPVEGQWARLVKVWDLNPKLFLDASVVKYLSSFPYPAESFNLACLLGPMISPMIVIWLEWKAKTEPNYEWFVLRLLFAGAQSTEKNIKKEEEILNMIKGAFSKA